VAGSGALGTPPQLVQPSLATLQFFKCSNRGFGGCIVPVNVGPAIAGRHHGFLCAFMHSRVFQQDRFRFAGIKILQDKLERNCG